MSLDLRRLSGGDAFVGFRSGEPSVDTYLKRFAKLNHEASRNVTWVIADGSLVVGFATVAGSSIAPDCIEPHIGVDLPNYPAPVLLLAQLGVSKKFQGGGLSRRLMNRVFRSAAESAEVQGCHGIVADALPKAVEFYRGRGFVTLTEPAREGGTTKMFRSLASVRTEFEAVP